MHAYVAFPIHIRDIKLKITRLSIYFSLFKWIACEKPIHDVLKSELAILQYIDH